MYDQKLNIAGIEWSPLDIPGVSMKVLRVDAKSRGTTVMTKMEPGAAIPAHHHTSADETVYVLEGDFIEDGQSFGPGSFFAGAAGVPHGPHSTASGCTLLTTFSAELDFIFVK